MNKHIQTHRNIKKTKEQFKSKETERNIVKSKEKNENMKQRKLKKH